MQKKVLFLFRHGPYGSSAGREGLDAVLVVAAFDQKTSLLFLDDGVFQLCAGQGDALVGVKNHSPAFASLPLYDVESIYVDADSLAARGLSAEDLLMPVSLLSSGEAKALLDEQDVVLSY